MLRRIDTLLSSDCNQWPFMGNGSVNTFPLLGSRFLIMQKLSYNNGDEVFLHGPCRCVFLEAIGAPSELRVVS
jgi:hypothetical protein